MVRYLLYIRVKGFSIRERRLHMTDEQIVALYWERSENAITETSKAYGRYVHYIAYSILRDDEDSAEIVNDTYLKTWNTIPPERPNSLKTFLGMITRQLSINRLSIPSMVASQSCAWSIRFGERVFRMRYFFSIITLMRIYSMATNALLFQ